MIEISTALLDDEGATLALRKLYLALKRKGVDIAKAYTPFPTWWEKDSCEGWVIDVEIDGKARRFNVYGAKGIKEEINIEGKFKEIDL